MDATDHAESRGTESKAPLHVPEPMETTDGAGGRAATATATIGVDVVAGKQKKDDTAPAPPSLAPPCLAAVRAASAALASEEAELAARAAADAARWDPDAWASTADKVLLPFVNPMGATRSRALERALLPSVSPPPPLAPPPPAIASVGDVVIVAAENSDDLSVLRVAPQSERGEGGGEGGEGGGDGGALPSTSTSTSSLPSSSTSRWSGDPKRGNSQACWVGTVRQLEAASGRALLGWLAPRRAKRSGNGNGNGSRNGNGSGSGSGRTTTTTTTEDEATLLSPVAPPADAAASLPIPSATGRGDETKEKEEKGEEEQLPDFSRSSWFPAPGLPADWLDASSPGILAVCRSLEKGTARVPAAALASARARLRALVAHDVAEAERERRKAGQQQ